MEQQPFSQQVYRNRTNSFATASIVFGILSIFSCMILYAAIFFGCMSILFALLSRQNALKMPSPSQAGCILSSISIVLSVILTAFTIAYLVFLFGWETVLNPEELLTKYMEYLNSMSGDLNSMGGMMQ